MLKHKKYLYIDLGKYFIKVRKLKNKDENSPDAYIVIGKAMKKSRNVEIKKLDDLPIEVKDKITKSL
ncbi:hypothetical protein DFR86_09760 [Acidianus sulfidivorans JP7]|uniref:DUF5622 domain-containing protein n=1 Tax=Acidianus sulfidivorans JP7 TaxID=619593 RepID=A0A2U9IP98_9CREN|nr:DUF5622 domain-containing protein [Acidianus sulfidivorans]AWR97804.1 hypothetical protein DFR86_09760 [Acidianus sulfidivorans JP7]